MNNLIKNRNVQVALALLVGITLGAIFYPTKTVEERVKKELSTLHEKEIKTLEEVNSATLQRKQEQFSFMENKFKQSEEESDAKLYKLTVENRQLKQQSSKSKFKLIKPDGTIIEKEYEESKSEEITSIVTEVRNEFNKKVSSIENNWKEIHQKRVDELKQEYEQKLLTQSKEVKIVKEKVEVERIVKINDKKLNTELGYSSDDKFYTHLGYTLWGPVMIGAGVATTKDLKEPEGRIGLGIRW